MHVLTLFLLLMSVLKARVQTISKALNLNNYNFFMLIGEGWWTCSEECKIFYMQDKSKQNSRKSCKLYFFHFDNYGF